MGIFTRRRTAGPDRTVTAALAPVDPSTFPIASPWSTGSALQAVLFADMFGTEVPANTRTAAMRLATIARARNLICSTIARLPLQQLTGQTPDPDQPAWIASAAGGVSPQHRIAWTVDDLMFYGWSVWWRDNDADGQPAAVQRVAIGDWRIDEDNVVLVNDQPARADQVIVIPGLHEGILSFGVDVLDDAATLHRNVRARIANPIPAVDLHQTAGEPLTKTERDDMIETWAAARQGKNGGVGYTSPLIEARELGMGADAQLMIEARNAAAVDLARLVGVHAGMVDATAPKASLNYETQTGRNQEFVDFDLAQYLTPITARLSLDDVTAPGSRVDFDLADYTAPTPSPAGPGFED